MDSPSPLLRGSALRILTSFSTSPHLNLVDVSFFLHLGARGGGRRRRQGWGWFFLRRGAGGREDVCGRGGGLMSATGPKFPASHPPLKGIIF